ncbi:MAG: MFS transporter [Candidatus Electrothrix scaldis]|nr:MAG: MFS transporter [Candidatus Electrothrix sp. GW3-3]
MTQDIDAVSQAEPSERSWKQSMQAWLHPRVVTMLFFGFSAGIPILLIFSSLSLWLREAGVNRSAVTFFSWAALGYSFKFVWAPLVDTLPLPFLTKKLGRRRGWLLFAQLAVITAICLMALTDPASGQQSLIYMAFAAVMLGFSSATQDIVIDAYRIECAEKDMQALLSSSYIAGYRVGMLVAGAGALFLAFWFGTSKEAYSYVAWQYSYLCMAGIMLVGVATTLLIPEPEANSKNYDYPASYYLRFLFLFVCTVMAFITVFFLSGNTVSLLNGMLRGLTSTLPETPGPLVSFLAEAGRLLAALLGALTTAFFLMRWNLVDGSMVSQTYINPVLDFFKRYGVQTALLLLTLVGFYRISDIVLGVIANVFYQDMGFSKETIASVIKTFGLFMTLLGGFLGGTLTVRYGVMKILFLGALLSSLTNLLFMLLAEAGNNVPLLYLVISADNLSGGIATTAFVAFLASLTNISFTAVQYAIFSSLMTLLPKLIGGYSGTMVTAWGYQQFFLITALMGIPVLVLIWLAEKRLQ